MDVSGQLHAPAALPTRKNPGTHSTGPTQPLWTFQNEGKKISLLPSFEPRFVQPGTKKFSKGIEYLEVLA
jgi:hypothetical protein